MSRRAELSLVLVLVVLFVLVRSYVFWAYEQAHMTSDQAIVGLMAKHIAEGRAVPLFFYGQSYMLALEAWLVAPFIWIGGPNVASLRAGMIAINLAAALLLVMGLVRWAKLRPRDAFLASLFFVLVPPFTSSLLVEAQGGNVEPIAMIVLLWWLRDRPLMFGALFGVAIMNREFIVFALPVFVIADLVQRGWPNRDFVRRWLLSAVMFLAVWQATNVLQPYTDLMGPGTRGQMFGGSAGSELTDVSGHMGLSFAAMPGRIVENIGTYFPLLLGGQAFADPVADQGRDAMRWPLLIVLFALAVRVTWLAVSRRDRSEPVVFGALLGGVGLSSMICLALVWGLTTFTLRYMMLSLLLPIGVVALMFVLEPRARVRQSVTALVIVWALLSTVDNVRLIRRYVGGRVPNVYGDVARALVEKGITVAQAPYWHAYRLTFLSGERVKIASTDFVRITEYQNLAGAAGGALVTMQEEPCGDAAEKVGPLYICRGG